LSSNTSQYNITKEEELLPPKEALEKYLLERKTLDLKIDESVKELLSLIEVN
jgi:hypothetical protein